MRLEDHPAYIYWQEAAKDFLAERTSPKHDAFKDTGFVRRAALRGLSSMDIQMMHLYAFKQKTPFDF